MIESDGKHCARGARDVIILYGALRSGTTMLRLMLAQHPALACRGETDFLFDHLHRDGETWRYDRARLSLSRIYRASPLDLPDELDGTAALMHMIEQICDKPGARPVLVLHRHADKALSLLPGATVIHLLRDPRDVARSAIGMGWAGNVYHGVGLWMETEDDWKTGAERHAAKAHDIRFEALVARPQETLHSLCAFLGVDYAPAMLDYDAKSTYAKPDARLATQWQRKLGPREIRRVEARLGERLHASGYAPSGLPLLRLSSAERLWLGLQNWVTTKSRLIRRYGLVNVLERKLARLAGLSTLEARAQARIDEITARYLK